MADAKLGVDEPTTIDFYLDAEQIAFGTTNVLRERVVICGTASGALAQFTSVPVLASALGLVARLGNSSGVNIGSVDILTAPTLTINALTTASKIQVEPGVGTTFNVAGNATVSPAAGTTFNIGGNATVSPAAGTTWNIAGNATVTLSALPGAVLLNATVGTTGLLVYGADGTASNSTGRPLQVNASGELKITGAVAISGNATIAALTTGSKVQVEPGTGAVFGISGNATVTVNNTTLAPVPVLLQSSTATVTIQGNTSAVISGNSTAIITTGSKIQVEPGVGAVFGISGNATVTVNNTTLAPVPVLLQSSTATVTIQGNATIAGNATVSPAAGTTWNIAGNATVTLSAMPGAVALNGAAGSTGLLVYGADGTASGSTARPLQVNASGELKTIAAVTIGGLVQLNATVGTTGMLVYGADGTASNSTARPLQVNASGELKTVAAVTIGGSAQINTTGGSTILLVGGMDGNTSNSTARALRVNASGELLTVGGTVTVGGLVQINTAGGSTAMLVAGLDGNTSLSTARSLKVNASQELIVAGAVTISGNSTAILTTGSKVQVEPGAGAVFGISGNATVTINNTTLAPVPVLLQSSTATVTIQGNASAVISGNSTAIISTASKIQVEPGAGAVFGISGNATVTLAALPGAVLLNTTVGTTGLLVYGADGTASNSTGRPLQVNASGELKVTGTVAISGNSTAILTTGSKVQVEPGAGAVFGISGNATVTINNTTLAPVPVLLQSSTATVTIQGNATIAGNATVSPAAGTTWNIAGNATVTLSAMPGAVLLNATVGTTGILVYGADGTASNSTGRPLRVNASGELLTVGGSVTVAGAGIINTTAGTSGLLILGADGNTSNSTARYLKINASQELVITGAVAISGNATIAGNTTAVVGNASGVFTTANPLPVYLQASTATVTIQGNATIAGNATAVLSTAGMGGSTATPVYVAAAGQLSQVYQGSTALTPQFSSINVTASGIAAIVTSAAGAVYVLAVQFSAQSSCTVQWMEATTSGLTGVQAVAANGGFVLPYNPVGWFKTASGLQLSLSVQGSSGGVGGSLVYARPAA